MNLANTMTPVAAEIVAECRESTTLPLVVAAPADLGDASAWAAGNLRWIEDKLLRHGALLFRGFGLTEAPAFEAFTRSIAKDFPEFPEESSPRTRLNGAVFTSTDYPAAYPIQFHNEYSYSQCWPLRIFFCCLAPPATEGQTPIADSRKVLNRLRPETREKFMRLGVMYRRNYMEGMGVSWQEAFLTGDRATVEARCRQLGIAWEWLDDDQLRTTQQAPAVARHPATGERVWFNHGYFFNIHALEPLELREFLLTQPEDDLSTNTYYGDGSPIAPETIAEIAAAYAAEAVMFDWRPGDVMLIDNMLSAHARRPYSGPRKIVTVLADPCLRPSLPTL
ncbi:MAG: TauD/TfdA family dioxygenase [Gammaproteobacteria bacterium]|nr:TauD/TfdA family dioxygenase [Gammaproteobacteria bacterium]